MSEMNSIAGKYVACLDEAVLLLKYLHASNGQK